MALPNPGMAFSPFDILTAEEMNDLVENIEALAAGTGLNNNVISSNSINFSTIRLGKGQITSPFPSTSPLATPTIVTGLSVTFTLTQTRTVRAVLSASAFSNSSNAYTRYHICNGTVSLANEIGVSRFGTIGANIEYPVIVIAERTLTAGTYTFNAGVGRDAGTSTLGATVTSPAMLVVDIVG